MSGAVRLAACVGICCSVAGPVLAQGLSRLFTLSPAVRAYGMGEAGVADESDPLNAFYNPAVIPSPGGMFLSGMYGRLLPEYASDMYVWHAVAGGAGSFAEGESIELRLGGSVGFSYVSYGEPHYEPNIPECGFYAQLLSEKGLSVALGGEAILGRTLHLGIGCAAKPMWIRGTERCHPGDDLEGNGVAFDIGALVSAELRRDGGWKVSPGVGFSLLDLGPDIELPRRAQIGLDQEELFSLPRSYRLGAGLRLEGPRSDALAMIAGTGLPRIVLTIDADLVREPEKADSDGGVGMEAALFSMLFARAGWVNTHSSNVATFGFGLGLTRKKTLARVDYATVSDNTKFESTNKFGLSFAYAF